MPDVKPLPVMEHPFPKSTSSTEKCKRLFEVVSPEDTLAVIINADPDAMASALALKRFFWRKVKKTLIYHVNTIKRADNLALIKLLKIKQQHIRKLNSADITKFAILDSQPESSLTTTLLFLARSDDLWTSKRITAPTRRL
ncbi:MAG: hypothetical protein P8175_07645 [Deltaproteobacteria bacterium]